MHQMQPFSFPTTTIPGLGLCVTRRILLDHANISKSQLSRFQQTLHQGRDYVLHQDADMARNYYPIHILIRLAQELPTIEAQNMAIQVQTFLNTHYREPTALPAGTLTGMPTGIQHSPQYSQEYAQPPVNPPISPVPTHSQMTQYSDDPRVFHLSQAIAHHLQPSHPPFHPASSTTEIDQSQLLEAARTLQSDAVGYVERGFNLATSAQDSTAAMIRRSRPTVTHNTDQRSYNAYEFLDRSVQGMSRLQFGILCSAIFCLVASVCYVTVASEQSNQRQYAPNSYAPTRFVLTYIPIKQGQLNG